MINEKIERELDKIRGWQEIMPEKNALEIGGHCDITMTSMEKLQRELLLLYSNLLILAEHFGEEKAQAQTLEEMKKLYEKLKRNRGDMSGPGRAVG